MATHICRDFLTRFLWEAVPCNTASSIAPEGASAYYLTMFLMGTMGWTVFAESNSDFAAPPGAGARWSSTQVLTGSSAFLVSCGSGGRLNLGTGREYQFEPPSGSHRFDIAASASFDVNRILVLRSTANPRMNSGLFRITAVHPFTATIDTSVNGHFNPPLTGANGVVWSGSFTIDYRSSQFPPPESGTLTWFVFQHEHELTNTIWNSADCPPTGVLRLEQSPPTASAGVDVIGRLVLQSPSGTWQLKLENELTGTDAPAGGTAARVSMAPGLGAVSGAQFPIAGNHLHGPRWFNQNPRYVAGSVAGLEVLDNAAVSAVNAGQMRCYMWGRDDGGINDPGAFVIIWRNVRNLVTTWRAFGFCEDEPTPFPPRTVQRMFAMGNNNYRNNHSSSLLWSTTREDDGDGSSNNTVVGFGLNDRPALGNISTWCFLSSQDDSVTSTPRSISISGQFPTTSSFTGRFELLPVDVMMETWDTRQPFQSGLPHPSAFFSLNGRRLGRFPIARYGVANRAPNHSAWSISDDTQWIHTEDGIYLPWSGTL